MNRKACRISGSAAVLVLTLAGCAAAAGKSAGPTAGTETFRGSTTNLTDIDSEADMLTVTATGLVADHGSISLAGNATSSVIRLSGGTLKVTHAQGKSHQGISKACAVTFWNKGTYKVLGGTGRYAHASGHGTATITFTGSVPKKKDGTCDTATDDVTGARETFTATGPLTLR
jgi:hypothetical protein